MQNLCITIMVLFAFMSGQGQAQVADKNKVKLPEANFLNDQLSAQLLNQTIALSDPSLIKAQAELLRKHYEALMAVGFNQDEALQIVIAMASRDKN